MEDAVPLTDTVTSTVPAVPAGLVALQVVVVQVTDVPATEPNSTVVPVAAKPVPIMLTTVPPARGPESGLILVTVGAVTADAVPAIKPSGRIATRRSPPPTWAARKMTLPKNPNCGLCVKCLALIFFGDPNPN
jgi:hypothetical protein